MIRYTDKTIGTRWYRNRWFAVRIRFHKPVYLDFSKRTKGA